MFILRIAFILSLFIQLAVSANESTDKQTIQLSISSNQQEEVKRIHDFFIEDLGKNPQDYQFIIQESDVLNAFATLGKKVTLTTGLIKKLKNESALAFVIAHEIGHIEEKHVHKGIARNIIGGLLKLAFFKEQSTASAIYDGVNYMHGKHYSRSKEKRADLFAVKLINKHYCKAPGKLEFFEEISNQTKQSKASEYFSTHPLPQSRIAYLHEIITDAGCVL